MSNKDSPGHTSEKVENGSIQDSAEMKFVYLKIPKGNMMEKRCVKISSKSLSSPGTSKFVPLDTNVSEKPNHLDSSNKPTFTLAKSPLNSSSSGKIISLPLNHRASMFGNKLTITAGGRSVTSSSNVIHQISPSAKNTLGRTSSVFKSATSHNPPNIMVSQGSNIKKTFTSAPKILGRRNNSFKIIPIAISKSETRRGINIYSIAKGQNCHQLDRVNFKITNGQIQSEERAVSCDNISKKAFIPTIDLVDDEESNGEDVFTSIKEDSTLNLSQNSDKIKDETLPPCDANKMNLHSMATSDKKPDISLLSMNDNVLPRPNFVQNSSNIQANPSEDEKNVNEELLHEETDTKPIINTVNPSDEILHSPMTSVHKRETQLPSQTNDVEVIYNVVQSPKRLEQTSIISDSLLNECLSSCKEVDAICEETHSGVKELLQWRDGTGKLEGSELKFRCNEYDAVELIEDENLVEMKQLINSESKNLSTHENITDSCVPSSCSSLIHPTSEVAQKEKLVNQSTIRDDCVQTSSLISQPSDKSSRTHRSRKPNLSSFKLEDKKMENQSSSSITNKDQDDICCCKNCGCYGLFSEFSREKGNDFCTIACSEDYSLKEVVWMREKARLMKNRSKSKKTTKQPPERTDCDVKDHTQLKENNFDPTNQPNFCYLSNPITMWRDSNNKVFSWDKYMEYNAAENPSFQLAPLKLWNAPFPTRLNYFKPTMKLEGVDIRHQSHFCVMTVAQVVGYRIRLHFDGFSDIFDFWCNADSPFIFPVGWCEENGKKLETPPGIFNFSWNAYLQHCKAIPAPEEAFVSKVTSTVPSHIRIGMKLEAENKNLGLYCVGTLTDIIGNRMLIHYDGWGKNHDTWFEMNSPFVHPVGWCGKNNIQLRPPADYSKSENFNWHEYLQETNSMAMPTRAFKSVPSIPFEANMKIEVVDKRNPIIMRVATIVEVKENKILVHFDGWPDLYDYYLDIDSPDIHPPTWCSKTGHPLQPPLTPEENAEDVDSGIGCGTPGCKGIGHVKGPIYSTHHTAFGCPYSLQNLDKDWETLLPDRLSNHDEDILNFKDSRKGHMINIVNLDISKPLPHELADDQDTHKKRVRKRRRFFDEISCSESSSAKSKIPRTASEEYNAGVKERSLSLSKSNDSHCSLPSELTSREDVQEPNSQVSSHQDVPITKQSNIDTIVHQSVFNPGYCPKPQPPIPSSRFSLDQHKHIIASLSLQKDVHLWTSFEVKEAIGQIPGNEYCAEKFLAQDIDGESLLMLTQNDMIDILGMKLGPAVKIMTMILALKNKS